MILNLHIVAETSYFNVREALDYTTFEAVDPWQTFLYTYIEGRQDLNPSQAPALLSTSFFDVFYNQVYLSPAKISAGLISEDKVYDIFIWNAFPYSITITNINKVNIADVHLSEDLEGYVVQGLEEKRFQLILPVSGEPLFNGFLEFILSNGNVLILYVEGSRLYVIPAIAFYDNKYTFSYEYLVSITKTRDGKEQRRLLLDKPVRGIDGEVYIELDKFALHWLDRLGGLAFAIPIAHEKLAPQHNNLQNRQVIYVEENLQYFTEISNCVALLVIRVDTMKYEVAQIESIDKQNRKITLKTPIGSDFPKRVTWIFPLLLASGNVRVKRKTNNYAILSISVREVVQ